MGMVKQGWLSSIRQSLGIRKLRHEPVSGAAFPVDLPAIITNVFPR
jgi:hypothetical protein